MDENTTQDEYVQRTAKLKDELPESIGGDGKWREEIKSDIISLRRNRQNFSNFIVTLNDLNRILRFSRAGNNIDRATSIYLKDFLYEINEMYIEMKIIESISNIGHKLVDMGLNKTENQSDSAERTQELKNGQKAKEKQSEDNKTSGN
jgi:hypothetical protein